MSKMLAEWFWIERWEGSSAAMLPMEAQGIYRAMLSHAWRRGASLPVDPEEIQLLIRCRPKEWKRSWPLVAPYWHELDGDLVNDTQREVYEIAAAKQARAKARAQAGAQARHKHVLKSVLKHEPPITNHQSNEIAPPRAREIGPLEADDESAKLGRELLAALEEAKRVTGRDGQTILADKRVRPSKGLPITNPLGCSPPAAKLWRVTIDRVKGYIAAYQADRGGKTFGRGWDSASDEPEEFQAAREWIRDNWPDDASPESRDALTGQIQAAGCPESLTPAVTYMLLPRFPRLSSVPSVPISARPSKTVTVAEPPKACGECNAPLTCSGGVYTCADTHGLGCRWAAVVDSARVA